MQPPGGSSDILVSDSSSSSSRASSVCGDEGETKPVKKLYRLNSSIVLGDVTAEVNSAPKPKTSIKVLNSDHPLVVDSVAALKIDTPQDAPQNGTKNPPTAQQDDLTEAVEDMASVPQSQESVCEEISTTPPPTDTDDVIPTAPPASPNVSAPPASPAASPVASSTQPTTEINLTNSNSAVFGANIPRLARRQPPGGRSTAFW